MCSLEHNCPDGPDGDCCGQPVTEPISEAEVTGLSLTCGLCEASIPIDDDDIDAENGWLEPWALFGECPSCGAMYDATGFEFSVGKSEPGE